MALADSWLQRAAATLALAAAVSPVVGMSFLFGYLANFRLFALHVVALEDVALASLLAAIVLVAMAAAWLVTSLYFFALFRTATTTWFAVPSS